MSDKISMPAKGISKARLKKLLDLREAGSPGDWRVDSGFMSMGSLWITTWLRERDPNRPKDDCDGPIASVAKERTVSRKSPYGDEYYYRKVKIERAEADAKLICEAVNVLPVLVNGLLSGESADDTAWLLEWPADKHNPIRYFSAGEAPVMNASDATRFSRKEDAEAMLRHEKLWAGARAVEHAWVRLPQAPVADAA